MDLASYSGIVVAKGAYFAALGTDLQIGSKIVTPLPPDTQPATPRHIPLSREDLY